MPATTARAMDSAEPGGDAEEPVLRPLSRSRAAGTRTVPYSRAPTRPARWPSSSRSTTSASTVRPPNPANPAAVAPAAAGLTAKQPE